MLLLYYCIISVLEQRYCNYRVNNRKVIAMPECAIANAKIHVEVPVLLLFFAYIFSESVKVNFIIFRTCYISLGYNRSECTLLGSNNADNNTSHLEKVVEPYAATINMVHTLTEAFLSAVTCLFIGPWSDKFGRKPVLVIPVVGFMLFYILFTVFAILDNISPWYSLLCSIPVYLTGGGSTYLTVVLCYITDVTNEANRGMRMGVFEAVLALGIFAGNISSSFVFAATNYPTVFLISASCCFLGIIFTIFFIPESHANPETEGRFKKLFETANVKDMIKTAFKKRTHYDRFIVLLCIFMLTIYILVVNGESALTFLYLREKFSWSLQQYTLFSAAHNVVWVVGTVIGIYLLHKVMKISETVMIVIGFNSMFVGMLFMGFVKYSWEVYAASFSRALGGILSPMVRSLVSKTIPNEEVGKVFALIVVSESLFGMVGSPMFTGIYNATISTDPAIFNFVGAGIYFLEILLAIGLIYVRTLSRVDNSYNQLINEDNNQEQSATNEIVA